MGAKWRKGGHDRIFCHRRKNQCRTIFFAGNDVNEIVSTTAAAVQEQSTVTTEIAYACQHNGEIRAEIIYGYGYSI